MFRAVAPLLKPKSMAIVGASETGGGGWTRGIFQNLEEAECPIPTYLINARRDELWGQKVYPDFASLPESIDQAMIIVPARFVNDMLREGVEHGLKAATVYSAGFGEGGRHHGAERGEELREIIAESGISVCGPNCMGTFSLPQKALLYPTTRLQNLEQGPVGGIFHSGGTLGYWFAQAAVRGLGFSYAVSCGNEFGLDMADYLNFLAEDEDTKIIVGMIESIRRPDSFMAAARKAFEAGKPVIMVKLGGSELGKVQAATHTGAVAVDDEVFNAACQRFGVVRCDNIDDMVDYALAFLPGRYPAGKRLGLVTSSGGAAGLTLDAVDRTGAQLAKLADDTVVRMEETIPADVDVNNPMDAGSTLAQDVIGFCNLSQLWAADPNVDALALQARLPLPGDMVTTSDPYVELVKSTEKPVFGFTRMVQNTSETHRQFQTESGMPILQGIPATVKAMHALATYAERRRRGIPEIPEPAGDASNLTKDALAAALAGNGLTPPRETIAATPAAAAAAAAEIGYPVALKIVSTDVSHKTEMGGVRLGLRDEAEVRGQAEDLVRVMEGHDLSGFLVQEMVDGLEFLVGLRDDEQFGPLVAVGLGGIFVELLGDVSLRLAPVDTVEVREMLEELRGAKALGGFRGQTPRDVDALAAAIAGLSEFFLDHRPWLKEIEINPLIVLAEGEGVRAVDVRPVRRGK